MVEEPSGRSPAAPRSLSAPRRPADAVAEDLAGFSQVFSVCQVVGTLDIEALAVARDQEDLNALLIKLAAVPGVRKLEPSVALDVLKNQSNWVPFGHGV